MFGILKTSSITPPQKLSPGDGRARAALDKLKEIVSELSYDEDDDDDDVVRPLTAADASRLAQSAIVAMATLRGAHPDVRAAGRRELMQIQHILKLRNGATAGVVKATLAAENVNRIGEVAQQMQRHGIPTDAGAIDLYDMVHSSTAEGVRPAALSLMQHCNRVALWSKVASFGPIYRSKGLEVDDETTNQARAWMGILSHQFAGGDSDEVGRSLLQAVIDNGSKARRCGSPTAMAAGLLNKLDIMQLEPAVRGVILALRTTLGIDAFVGIDAKAARDILISVAPGWFVLSTTDYRDFIVHQRFADGVRSKDLVCRENDGETVWVGKDGGEYGTVRELIRTELLDQGWRQYSVGMSLGQTPAVRVEPDPPVIVRFGSVQELEDLPEDSPPLGMLTGGTQAYCMSDTLHAGSYGEVCYGVAADGDRVAIKQLDLLREDSSPQTKERLLQGALREVAALSFNSESGALKPYDVIRTDDDYLFIVMPFYDGAADVFNRDKNAASPDVATWLFTGIIKNLAALHASGRAHCDIKRANIFFGKDGQVALGDRGMTLSLDAQSAIIPHDGFYGTVGCLAPELVADAPFDTRADMWSLGIMMLELLSGEISPFMPDDAEIVSLRSASGSWLIDECQKFSLDIYAAYQKWWRGVTDSDGKVDKDVLVSLDLGEYDVDDDRFTASFSIAYANSPEWTRFIVERLLVPEPAQRLTSERAAGELPLRIEDPEALAADIATAADQNEYASTIFAALDAARPFAFK